MGRRVHLVGVGSTTWDLDYIHDMGPRVHLIRPRVSQVETNTRMIMDVLILRMEDL